MLLDNDFDVQKNIKEYAEFTKMTKRNLKQYVAWIRQNIQEYNTSFSGSLDKLHFEAELWSTRPGGFSIPVDSRLREQIEKNFRAEMLTLGLRKANKRANNAYVDVLFDLVKSYVDEHNIDLRLYEIKYASKW